MSSHFFSRLLSLSSRQGNNDDQQLEDTRGGGDDDIEVDEAEEIFFDNDNDDTPFSSYRKNPQTKNSPTVIDQSNGNNNSFHVAAAVATSITKRMDVATNDEVHEQQSGSISVTADMEASSIYEVCNNIDESMVSLYNCFPAESTVSRQDAMSPLIAQQQRGSMPHINNNNLEYEYDWILDGDPQQPALKETDTAASRRRRLFGDDKLDLMLGMLEIENQEFVSSDEDSLNDGSAKDNDIKECDHDENLEEGENQNADNTDFSKLGLDSGRKSLDNDEYCNEFGTFTVTQESIQPSGSEFSYKPPASIGSLVNDINTQLDTTIDECLDITNDVKSVETNNIYDCQDDHSASEDLRKQINQSETALQSGQNGKQAIQQQSLLMSAALLESLPIPKATDTFGDVDDELIASLTRRIQQHHQRSRLSMTKVGSDEDDGEITSSHIDNEDDLLEHSLSDIIHSGYFDETDKDVNDEHYFDSIVLEEILTVPWPFHEITDLNEPLFGEGVFDSSDSDDSDEYGIDALNFDTYISNRLSQLHQASGKVVSCLHKRASEREESINTGIQGVFAAEIDIESALLITKSSREFLHRAIHGYPVTDCEGSRHNAVSGSLEVLEYSDFRDRLGLLLVAVDRISSIREEEVNWRNELSNQNVTADKIPSLVEGTMKLMQLTVLEESLTHLDCMKDMKARMSELPNVLVCLIEECLARLLDRILATDEIAYDQFDEYFQEYQVLLRSWIDCVELRDGDSLHVKDRCSAVSTEWSGCILDMLSFSVKKAFAYSMIDSFSTSESEVANDRDLNLIEDIREKLKNIRFRSKDESELEALSQKLLLMRVGGIVRVGGTFNSTALSLTFFHLSSRLVELMSLYEVIIQWHQAIVTKTEEAGHESEYDKCDQDEDVSICTQDILLEPTIVSMVSSNEDSSPSCDLSEDEAAVDAANPVPNRIAFKESKISGLEWSRKILQSVGCVRQALWKYCEESLIHLVESFSSDSMDLSLQSGQGVDSATSSLHLTYYVFQQFVAFSKHFNCDSTDEGICDGLKDNLLKLYRTHLRSVHIEAMKSTGSLLRQESWQLSPINISRALKVVDSKVDQEVGALYEAVNKLLTAAYSIDFMSTSKCQVTARSQQRGYQYCTSFATFLQSFDQSLENHVDDPYAANDYHGIRSTTFCSAISPLIERSPCGELTLTLLSTSSTEGLFKWIAHLLAIGNNLPLVEVDATKAIVTLFDLYFLTVLRICAVSRTNEDVLVGLGRGSAVPSLSSSLMSVTMEADACAPLPSQVTGFATLQQFIKNSRARLDRMVNLDKFQSTDQLSVGTPVNQHKTNAQRLEKDSAAAFSCLITTIVVDVASRMCSSENVDSRNDVEVSLTAYAQEVTSMVPTFVEQCCRLSAVRSLSGKEMIFKVICCGKAWTDNDFKEFSNDYVDDLGERASLLWGHIASRGSLTPSVQKVVWGHLLKSSFMLLLEGFSKVTTCSTEGRSLMSMDLATLSSILASDSIKERLEEFFPNVCLPPALSDREESMRYVDTWIKVFFFPDEDAMEWIKQNRGQYHLDHSISLIVAKMPPKRKQIIAAKKKAVMDAYNNSN